jgi:hypothetical protein
MNETVPAALERRPHEATRAVVEVLGGDAPRALYRAFDAFNAEHFAGALGSPLLFCTQTSSPRALGDYCGRDVHGLRSRIRIAPRALARGERFAVDVLLHEMVHAWQSEVDGDEENGYKGHGPRFAAKCNAIGAAFGLPPVGVKGRQGLPDCAQWPMCVRPAGYYPEAKRRRAPARAPRKGGGAGGESPSKGSNVEALCSALGEAVAIVEDLSAGQRRRLGFDAWLAAAKELLP